MHHPNKTNQRSHHGLDQMFVAGDYDSGIISQYCLISILMLSKASSHPAKSHTNRYLQHSIPALPQLNEKRENLLTARSKACFHSLLIEGDVPERSLLGIPQH